MFKSNHTAGMIWFEGVVEDRVNDPLKLGRVRVRVFGQHTESLTDIPSDTLRWATVMMPTTSASMNGIGSTPSIVEGTHVIGFFRDGSSSQEAIIIGTIPGLNVEKPDTSKGFSDVRVDFSDSPEKASYNSDGSFSSIPAGSFPKDDFLDEPDTNRLARNENTEESIIKSKQATREKHTEVKGVAGFEEPDSAAPVIVNEPSESYNAKYPYNKVLETESGHVIELDDTKGSERVMIAHRSGTYIELTPEGNAIIKTVGDKYNLNSGDIFSHSANSTVAIDGQGTVHILGSADVRVKGTLDILSKGAMSIKSEDSITMVAPKIDLNP